MSEVNREVEAIMRRCMMYLRESTTPHRRRNTNWNELISGIKEISFLFRWGNRFGNFHIRLTKLESVIYLFVPFEVVEIWHGNFPKWQLAPIWGHESRNNSRRRTGMTKHSSLGCSSLLLRFLVIAVIPPTRRALSHTFPYRWLVRAMKTHNFYQIPSNSYLYIITC